MKTYLVTGGAGFIASHIASRLAEDSSNLVVVVDNFLTGSQEKVPKKSNVRCIKADVNKINEIAPIFYNQTFDAIFHYAAVVGVKRTLDNPALVLQDIEGFKNILDLAKSTGVKRVLFSSSSEVYGESISFPQHEQKTPLNSRLPYAIVKNVGEAFCRSYQQEFNLDYTIFRFFNTYGPGQSEDFVVSKFINAALRNEDITIYGDGSQSRTFCYIDDNIEATTKCLTEEWAKNVDINIGNDIEVPVIELADMIIKLAGSKSKIVKLPPLKEGDMSRRQPDIAQMKRLLGRDLTSLEEGLRKTIEFFRQKSN